MSDIFSFSRLLQLVRKQWIENARLYVLSTLALIGILGMVLLFWFFSSSDSFKEEALYIIFTFGIYIAGGVFASMSFNMLGEKEKGTYWLAFPASQLEKLLCILLYNVVFFTLVYGACFLLLKTVAFTYIQNLIAINPAKYHWRNMDWRETSNEFSVAFPYFMYAFFAVQAFYVLGSIYFVRFSFVLTTVVGAALIAGFMWYAVYLSKNMLPDSYHWNGNHVSTQISDSSGFTTSRYDLPGLLSEVFSFLVKFVWAPVFWIATWYRLREKQI
ncbi:MAG: hypothetical protein ABJB11_24645 [Ferruginibacter sp.]